MGVAMRPSRSLLAAVLALAVVGLAGCSSYKATGGGASIEERAANTVSRFRAADPSLEHFFDTAAGYAVYPTVAKGGAGVGAAHGRGVLYEDGEIVGYTSLTQGNVGFQLGGQAYSEIIFFRNGHTLENFKRGNLELSAQASAVAATAGAAANADFDEGVAVFTRAKGGLMYEASIGGQKFSYSPK